MTVPLPAPSDQSDLLQFAWVPPDFIVKLGELAEKALDEEWDDPKSPTGRLPILSSYLRFTFKRLVEEDKIAYSTDQQGKNVACFNTGLFTAHYEPIYACLEANQNPDKQPWILREWALPVDYKMRPFANVDVKAARYFDRPDELIYDPDLELVANLDHILDDNAERFPAELQSNAHHRRLLLDAAIREAGKRAQMNWKTAVPQYYFGSTGRGSGRIQLLLPLCLMDADHTDLALVVDKSENKYRAYTVLTLAMAYKNARLISRQDSDWLGSADDGPATTPTASVEEVGDFDTGTSREHQALTTAEPSAADAQSEG
jgi:hypothetical protein